MINITKTLLPDINKYFSYMKGIWERGWITNNGELTLELENKLQEYLGVRNLILVNSGTTALQIAIKSLSLKGEIITTPFSFIATTSSIIWENCKPVFCDIDKNNYTVDVNKIENLINKDTSALLFTHVFGHACDVEKINLIAKKHNVKVIYDAAHAFDVKYRNESILNYGDISILSFHATKIFHTAEGGALITEDNDIAEKIRYMRNFGYNGPESFFGLGINGKLSELHAAMGLCILPLVATSIEKRKKLTELYDKYLFNKGFNIQKPKLTEDTKYNYSYYPVLFSDTEKMLKVKELLEENGINTRRYFYPSLNTVEYIGYQSTPNSEDISSRILCLPLYDDLTDKNIELISDLIISIIN